MSTPSVAGALTFPEAVPSARNEASSARTSMRYCVSVARQDGCTIDCQLLLVVANQPELLTPVPEENCVPCQYQVSAPLM